MAIPSRPFGRTGLSVSVLGFGCGAVGGLMVRGEPGDQELAVGLALDHGVTFFDTAPAYGDGRSETNLGRVLAKPRPEITLATKFSIRPEDRARIPAVIRESLAASLGRLGRSSVDILQLHNSIGGDRPEALPAEVVLGEVIPTLQRLQSEGLIRFFGITGVGENEALAKVVDSGGLDSLQVPYNLLNPSNALPYRPGMVGADLAQLIRRADAAGTGSIGIRALAGGAISGTTERHPIATETVGPIGTGTDYAADVAAARRFDAVVAATGADSLIEAALRFATGPGGPSLALVGVASVDQLAYAIASVEKGPVTPDAFRTLEEIWGAR